jgi:hypothetical protein
LDWLTALFLLRPAIKASQDQSPLPNELAGSRIDYQDMLMRGALELMNSLSLTTGIGCAFWRRPKPWTDADFRKLSLQPSA